MINKLTVANLLQLESLHRGAVLSGRDALNGRVVDWISVIEVPVEDFVRRDEFVLTTGMGCGHDPELIQNFVVDIMASGASGLAIAVGPYVSAVPPEVVELAEKAGFPLIALPWDVRFADVSRQAFAELTRRERGILEQVNSLEQSVMLLIAEDRPLDQIVEVIAQKIHGMAVVVDDQNQVRAKSSSDSEGLEAAIQLSAMHGTPLVWSVIGQQTMTLVPIRSLSRTHGSLIIGLNDPGGTREVDYTGLESVATALALWFLREQRQQESLDKVRQDFIWSLAKGELADWDEVLRRARPLGYDMTLNYVALAGAIDNLDGLYQKSQTVFRPLPKEQWLDELTRTVLKSIRETAKKQNLEVLATYQREGFVVFLEMPRSGDLTVVHGFLDALEAQWQKRVPHMVISWGIGEEHPEILGFHESFQNARAALELGSRQHEGGHRTLYSQSNTLRVIMRLAQDREMRDIVQSTIGILKDYDKKRGSDLVRTLTAYLLNRTNVSQTSRALNLHRQSLLYRLRKIESLTGRSLDNPDDLFLLELSVRLVDVNQDPKDLLNPDQ